VVAIFLIIAVLALILAFSISVVLAAGIGATCDTFEDNSDRE